MKKIWKNRFNFYIPILCFLMLFTMVIDKKEEKKLIKQNNELKAQLETKIEQQTEIVIQSKFNFAETETIRHTLKDITITSYNNHSSQTDSTPNITATNRPVREGMVAVSPDLLKKGIAHYGDLLYISCFDKWYLIEDTMNSRFERRVDIFLFDKQESLKINKKCDIEILHYTK